MFKDSVEKFYPEMEAIRDDIHMHPELSNQEFRTSALVMEQLKSYGLDSVEQIANTGVVGLLVGQDLHHLLLPEGLRPRHRLWKGN